MVKSFNSRALSVAYGTFNPVQKQTYKKLLTKKGIGPDKAMKKLGVRAFSVPKIPSTTTRAALKTAYPKKRMWFKWLNGFFWCAI